MQDNCLNLPSKKLCIRERLPADRCQPKARKHSQKLKIIFQEHGISATERKQAWIICDREDQKNIIAVYPFFICTT